MKNNYHCLKEVDVLLPIHYSNEEYLIESINSLLNQTLKPNIICLLNGMDRNSNIYYENIGFTQRESFEIEGELKISNKDLYKINNQWYNSY